MPPPAPALAQKALSQDKRRLPDPVPGQNSQAARFAERGFHQGISMACGNRKSAAASAPGKRTTALTLKTAKRAGTARHPMIRPKGQNRDRWRWPQASPVVPPDAKKPGPVTVLHLTHVPANGDVPAGNSGGTEAKLSSKIQSWPLPTFALCRIYGDAVAWSPEPVRTAAFETLTVFRHRRTQ